MFVQTWTNCIYRHLKLYWIYPIQLARVYIHPKLSNDLTSFRKQLLNLSEPFFDTTVGPRPNLARMWEYRRDWLSPKQIGPPHPRGGFRGLSINDVAMITFDVGVFVCLCQLRFNASSL